MEINTAGRADVASVDIKMKKADYTWGATMDKFMMNGEVTDLGQFRNDMVRLFPTKESVTRLLGFLGTILKPILRSMV